MCGWKVADLRGDGVGAFTLFDRFGDVALFVEKLRVGCEEVGRFPACVQGAL